MFKKIFRPAKLHLPLNRSFWKSTEHQSLEDRRNTHSLGLVKRCLNNNVPQFLKNYFKLNKEVISRETRRSNFIYLPAVRTETAKKSFYYNGSVVYNNYLVNKN